LCVAAASNASHGRHQYEFNMTLTLQLIEQAIALGEAGNFARAAERLGISQPTLSRNISSLETKLGLRLFDRGRSGATPTVFGRTVIDRGASLVRDAGALHAELQALDGLETGRLDIAAGPYVADDLVAPAVARLIAERPGLRVRVTVVSPEEIGAEVLSGRQDLGLGAVEWQAPHDELVVDTLHRRRLFLACRVSHPLAGTRPTRAQVLAYPFVTVMLKGQVAQVAAGGSGAGSPDTRRKGFAPAIEVNSLDTAKRIALASDALVPASASMIATELACGMLVQLDYDSPVLRTHPALVRLRHRTLSPAARRFVELVRACESELVAANASATAIV
jgi:DNA-binding transcriptional LysR family regulator